MLLTATDLQVHKDRKTLLDHASFSLEQGEVVGLIGPNGAGKSTLMRATLGLISATGTCSLWSLSSDERAKAVAWLPQERHVAWNLTVEAIVGFGRIPHAVGRSTSKIKDLDAIHQAMDDAKVLDLANRDILSLSGGEKARVLLARALAQEAPLLIADEPIAALDPAHQITTMEIFKKRARQGHAVLTSLHDLSLAAQWCDRVLVMHNGQIRAAGTPQDVLSDPLLEHVFGVRFHRTSTPQGFTLIPLEKCAD